MIITGISRYGEKASQKRPRYKIEVDGEYWYILSDVLIADFHLRKGMEVDEAFLQKVREAADYRKGRERAFYLLEEREHTRDELTRKLARSVGFETAGKIAGEMESLGLIREDAYAARYAQYLSETRRYGLRRIVQLAGHQSIIGLIFGRVGLLHVIHHGLKDLGKHRLPRSTSAYAGNSLPGSSLKGLNGSQSLQTCHFIFLFSLPSYGADGATTPFICQSPDPWLSLA